MKRFIYFCAMVLGMITCSAQTVIETFNVGPYIVDYKGQGDVNYRLRDNINLFEFFELEKDTIIVNSDITPIPVKNAIQISAVLGANLYTSKEFGIEGLWKTKIGKNLYFNGGLSFIFDQTKATSDAATRSMFELGVPLQIELGNLNRQKASLYGLFGLAPTFYSTMKAEEGKGAHDGEKKSGMLIAPSIEFGGNIPLGDIIMRIGVYGKYKINCSTSGFDVYKECVGRAFIGGKISIVI